MESWSRAVLEWVNCLDILDTNVNDLRELQDGKFCAKLIKILSDTESRDDGDDRDLISRFIEDKYPEFFGENTEEEENHKEIHIVSLLLLHSSHEPKLHRPMCIKLSNETQIKIKSFLEKVLEYGSSVTRDNINTAIMETTENFVRTPPATPKMRTLKDFFNSPATTVRKNYNKIMDERTREVRSLKAALETEKFEKADLQEDLDIQRQKNLSLQQKLQEKMAEIKTMREESVRFDTPQSSKKKNDIKTPRVRLNAKLRDMTEEVTLLKSEIINLQDEKQSLMRKLASVERSCVTFKERSKMNERNLETLLIQADIKDQEIAELKNHNDELRSHIQEMRRQTIAEQSFEMEMTTMSASNNTSLNGSEILSSVIDIQLQEAKEESKVFKFQVEDLNRRLESVRGDYQVLQQSNQTLEAEVSQFKTTKQQLNEVRKELDKYIEISKSLETEKAHFEEQTKKFESLFLSKKKLLEQSEQRNKQTLEDLRDLESKLKTVHDSLNREKDSIRNLEALIFEREEMLKTEYSRYEDLDQKYTILKLKNSDILERVEDLESLVSAKENSLSQAQIQREALELDLQNLKDELKDVQDLLSTEKTRVEDLESMIFQMKLEHEETLKMQLLRYQNLEEKYVNLKRDREELNSRITLIENLWKESSERNENLASDLRDLNGKLQTAENRLDEEKKRVEDLESAVTQVETDKREFIESQFSKYQTLEDKYVNLEKENLRLVKDIEDLNNGVSLKEQSIKQCSKEIENLKSTLQDLNEKFLNSQDSLGEERTRVEDLEATITRMKQENEGTLQQQLMRYQALQKIHTNAEEEKVNLAAEINRLKSLILSKEELLEQFQKQNGEFEVDLRKLNGDLLTVQGLLNVESTKVNDLESTLSKMKLQHEKTVQGETARYKELEEKHVNLENEKVNLLQEIENLNHKIADKENLLTQVREKEEHLISKLGDLNGELQSLQNSLAEERSRVEDLESTVIRMKHEKEEIVEMQALSYQSLEKKYMRVEKEKLDLLKNTENLNISLSSKEELLQQLQQHNSKLEVDLCDLNDELKSARTKVKSLESALAETRLEIDKIIQSNESLNTEISLLKSAKDDLYKVKEQLHKETEELNQQRSRLLGEIEELKTDAASKEEILRRTQQQNEALQSKLEDLNEEVKSAQNLLRAKSNRVEELESTVMHVNQEKEEMLQSQLRNYEGLEKKLIDVEQQKLDLLKSTENLTNLLSSKEELLQQSQDELNEATKNIESLESALAEARLETKKIIQSNESLHADIRLLKSAEDNLYEVKEQLHKRSEELEQEKSSLLEEIKDLKTHATLKEELLRQTQQQNEALHSKLNDLDEEVKSMKNLLNMKSSRIEELESTLTHIKNEREEMLQSQFTSYQTLEKKHTDVEQEKLKLLKDAQNLKNLLFSKEELLQQSQQHSVKLEGDLCDTKDVMKTVQNELDAAKANIEILESALAETKLKTDEIIQLNESLRAEISLLKSANTDLCNAKAQLYKQSEKLEQERSNLLEKVEELTTDASAKEELLRQTQRQNEALQLKLKDLDEEVKSAHNLLSAKSIRIKELESILFYTKQEKEEMLQSQLMSYQALEKKHMDVEQEKLDLLQDAENLKNAIVSKEEILQQSQKHSAKLEGDLCDAKDEMKTMQDEIEAVTTKVKSLESAFAETKLETQKIIQSNESLHAEISLLKSARDALDELRQQLHKQSGELEQEKSRLEGEIEELKTHATSKEELLKQTQQQNGDLSKEIKSLQNLLSVKSTRVESLESILAETESERKESLSIIEKLKFENAEHKNLIQGCTLILTELVKRSSQLTGNEITDIGDLTILDLSKQLKTLINSLEVIHNAKNSDLKNFEATVTALGLTVSKLKTDIRNFEEMKMRDDKAISEYFKEITDLRIIAEEKDTMLENMDKLKQQLSDERSKADLLNEEKMLLGNSLLGVKRALISLKNERSVLVENVKNQNEDLLAKMESISEIIVKMQDQIKTDNCVIQSLSEEKTLSSLKYDEEKRAKEDLEMKCESLENENKNHAKEKKELKDKLNVIRVRNAKLEKNLDELRKENKKLESEKPSAEDESKLEELNNSISKLQLQIEELEAEKIELSKRPTEQEFDSRIKDMHVEYNEKLEKIKQKMKMAYNEQIAKVNRDQERLMQEKLNLQRVKMEEQCRKHAEEMTKYKEHVEKLSSDYWDVGEKLLVEKQQKEELARQLQDLRIRSQYQRISTAHSNVSQPASTARSKTSSLDRREFPTTNRDELSAPRTVATIKEEVSTCPRRESIQSVQAMQGMGNAFKVEDEEGEVFNTNYLADMKAGRCSLAPDLDRLSVLQLRNAQCKPHLKSSYPAETQFQPETFTEEEIKGNESRSPNSRILRERNVERRSTATPRRLKDLFGGSSRRQDENVSGTPNRRRLSSIFRKPK